MARREKRISVYEPRRHGRKWRVEVRDAVTGCRSRPSFDSEAEAWKEYHRAIQEAQEYQEPTVGEVIDLYENYLIKDKGNRLRSVDTTITRLNKFFVQPGVVMSRLSPRRMQAYYDLCREGASADTHRNELAEVKTFLRWCVKKGHIRKNPAEEVEPVGKRKKGKPQLRAGEAVTFLERVLVVAVEGTQKKPSTGKQSKTKSRKRPPGSDGALAAAMALLMGLRSQEISRRVVRDVDVHTRVLYVEDAKTEAGNRRVEIPDLLWPHIEQRIAGKKPADPLFPARTDDGFHHKEWVGENTKRICKQLGLPEVCAHGLRGTHSTIAQEAGATGHLVARQLGHESVKTTHESYTAPGTVERQERKAALEVLTGGKRPG